VSLPDYNLRGVIPNFKLCLIWSPLFVTGIFKKLCTSSRICVIVFYTIGVMSHKIVHFVRSLDSPYEIMGSNLNSKHANWIQNTSFLRFPIFPCEDCQPYTWICSFFGESKSNETKSVRFGNPTGWNKKCMKMTRILATWDDHDEESWLIVVCCRLHILFQWQSKLFQLFQQGYMICSCCFDPIQS